MINLEPYIGNDDYYIYVYYGEVFMFDIRDRTPEERIDIISNMGVLMRGNIRLEDVRRAVETLKAGKDLYQTWFTGTTVDGTSKLEFYGIDQTFEMSRTFEMVRI